MLEQIQQLQKEILSGPYPEKETLVDRMVELDGFENTMQFVQSLFRITPPDKNLTAVAAHIMNRLLKLRALETIGSFKFCPDCKLPLNQYELIDPYLVGFKCKNDHRFHVEIDQNQGYDISLKVEKENYIDIAKEWLSDKKFRDNIHSQIAEILRKYVELNELNQKDRGPNKWENYCPVCSLALKKFEQDDVWVKGLKCANEHIFYSRNGLTYNNTALKPDIDKNTFLFLIDAYLGDEQNAYLPDQIVTLFTAIK